MALVKNDHTTCSTSSRLSVTRKRIETGTSLPHLNYDWLEGLCSIKPDASQPPEEAQEALHCYFMQQYRSMFVEDKNRSLSSARYLSLAKRPGKCSRSIGLSASGNPNKLRGCQHNDEAFVSTHNIQDYMLSIRSHKKTMEKVDVAKERLTDVALLRKLVQKSSVERSRDENHQIYKVLKKFILNSPLQVKPDVLGELCTVAQLEVIDEAGVEVDASASFYLILYGSVSASPGKLPQPGEESRFVESTVTLPPVVSFSSQILSVGDSFGVLANSSEDYDQVATFLSACTIDAQSEFLRITSTDYQRILQKIQRKSEHEKVEVIENCKMFADWSKQPMNKVAQLVKWMKFPSGTVLVKEGDVAGYIGVVKTGECRILRQIEAVVTLANGKKVSKKREVEMSCIRQFDSFGELSVLFKQPMTYTVLTSSAVELAIIEPTSLAELDATTLQLYKHSSERLSRTITQAAMEDEYLRQEEKRRWNKLKSKVLNESLYYCGIQNGVGKWK